MSAIGQLYSLRGAIRLARFRLRHHRPSLDRAIRHLERSGAHLRASHEDRPLVLAALSNGLLWRYDLTSDRADLDGAVARLREAIAAPATTAAVRAAFGADLAAVLRTRFLVDGDPADLDCAIGAATGAIESGDSAVTNRALALLTRYEQTAHLPDLLAALRDARTPVRGAVNAALDRGQRQAVLLDALTSRYQYTDDPSDLAEAIDVGRSLLATLSRFDPNRALYATQLSAALRLDPSLSSEAVKVAFEAASDVGSAVGVDHAYRLSALSMALLTRHLRNAREKADEAVAHGAGRNLPLLRQRVGLLARRWFDVTRDAAALAHGIAALRDALDAVSLDNPSRVALICELADLLARRRADAEVRDLLADALRAQRGTLAIRNGLRAATRLGELGAGAGDSDQALFGYRRAVELLHTAAWPGLRRAVREARLAEAPRATDAAAQAVRASEERQAVELLESGRSVLWAQKLNLRTDLARLHDAAPDLARRLNAIRVWFERREAGIT